MVLSQQDCEAEGKAGGRKASVDAMMAAYPDVQRRHLTPADAGLDQVGHFGYFKASAQPLWAEAVSWLKEQPKRTTAGH